MSENDSDIHTKNERNRVYIKLDLFFFFYHLLSVVECGVNEPFL